MKTKQYILLLIMLTGIRAQAQNADHKIKFFIPDISLLDIESGGTSKDIVLQVLSPNEAGLPASTSFEGSNSVWLNYTSIKRGGGNGNQKNILVRISNGNLPDGIQLRVKPYAISNYGQGKKGVPVAEFITLSYADQVIISEIESAFTGNGNGKGHKIEYSLLLNEEDTEGLDQLLDETELTITYTLTED